MVVPVLPAALIISTTMPDGPTALPNFIFEMASFMLSIVIGVIRIHHECEGGIEKSVLRITDCHH